MRDYPLFDRDDQAQERRIFAWLNPHLSGALLTHATRRAVQDAYRVVAGRVGGPRRRATDGQVSLDRPVVAGSAETFAAYLPNEEAGYAAVDDADEIECFCRRLTQTDRQLVQFFLADGGGYGWEARFARVRGISLPAVSMRLRLLRKHWGRLL